MLLAEPSGRWNVPLMIPFCNVPPKFLIEGNQGATRM